MKTIFQNIKSNYKLFLVVLLLGLILGWLIAPGGHTSVTDNEHAGHNHEEEASVWTCSMHPQIKQDNPGLCPICAMDLIPLTSMSSAEENADPNEIVMSESAVKLADIQTSIVTLGEPVKSIHLQGKLHVDERRIAELTARFGGRIEELFINFTGQEVKKGQNLAAIYSPSLVSAQRELIEASKYKAEKPSLYKAARAKLRAWDLTDGQIRKIEASGEPEVNFNILSPITGTVMMRHVALGDYVEEGKALFKVVDLTKLWVLLDAYERDLPWIKIGDKVSFTTQALAGDEFISKVSYIDPYIDNKTRVATVRAEINNSDRLLKPGMFTRAVLDSKIAEGQKRILIPKTAVLWTGKRAVVYTKVMERESPTFLYREIVLGPEAGAYYVVKKGLEAGEEIATNGVFKIDAAAQLIGLTSMMNAPDHQHLKTESFTVAGNCGMCLSRIEKAAKTVYGVSSALWDEDTKQISIQFDSEKTMLHDVHEAIAKSGHDTDLHKADDKVYQGLPGCCLYDRLDENKHDASSAANHAEFKVGGNCGMCQDRIETAAMGIEGVMDAKWDKASKMIHVDFHMPANEDAIQKAIARVGHDTEKYKADDEVYNALHSCCLYDRLVNRSEKTSNSIEHAEFKVGGNCGMCQDRIETAAMGIEGVMDATWDKDSKMIQVNFHSPANEDAIQKAIAKVGHDTEKYKADDEVYKELHSCCKYPR